MTAAHARAMLLARPDAVVRREPATSRVSLVAGAIFVIAGLVKFVFHHWELHAFRSFGLPWAGELEILAGVLETAGGLLLIGRRWILPSALLLSATMVVAIVSSGILHGDVIPSLTLAPALLLAVLFICGRVLRDARSRRRSTAA
ncbi:MAG TPA: DoxX family protein [Solirubrobacteraceae bacterium]